VGREILTYDELITGFVPASPVAEGALTIPTNDAPAGHTFEGRLELVGEMETGDISILRGDPEVGPELAHLPEFDFEFIQHENYLVPSRRGLIITEHPYWNYLIGPGRVWMEEGDGGYSRASFPFALVWKGSNAIFNGVMTFLYNDQHISKVWYQITQETSISTSLDFFGLLDAVYHSGSIDNGEQLRSDFSLEVQDRFPTKPIEELAQDYPGIDLSAFGRGVSSDHMTWYGFVINSVNYIGGCQTRYGTYPYCEYMRAPSYSTAKSAFVSVALMRLAQELDSNVSSLLIKDYLPETTDSIGDWSEVTFDNTLDMATGNYRSAGFMVDEENFATDPFWTEDYYTSIIAAALNWPNSNSPGSQWVYPTSDTFILTRALQNYLNALKDTETDIFQYVVDEVYKPIKINPGTYSVLRTKDNNWQGQPYGGLGLWWIPDDLVKITSLLNVDRGAFDGEQILHPDLVSAALQNNPEDRGVEIDSRRNYNNAFWSTRYSEANGYDCEFWVTQMLGYSGIVVALMPNGTTYYYASDNRDFTWDAALKEADKIIPHCQADGLVNPGPAGNKGDIWSRSSDEMEMLYVPGNTFLMGSTDGDINAAISQCREHYSICNSGYYLMETPQHPVTLDDYWIDQTEVINAQFQECVAAGVCQTPTACGEGDSLSLDSSKVDHPVVCVDWYSSQTYCDWAGARLPTEAEWEYASRGPDSTIYPWGETFDGEKLNYCDASCDQRHADEGYNDGHPGTASVGSYPQGASWIGALDLAGNVFEWTADWMGPYSEEILNNPLGPGAGSEKILRGSSWFYHPARARGAARDSAPPEMRLDYLGFRCALEAGS
jgi:formylglycine-generating enzyme required for sulfatase activity